MTTRPLDPHADAFCRVIAEMIVSRARDDEPSRNEALKNKHKRKAQAQRVRK